MVNELNKVNSNVVLINKMKKGLSEKQVLF